MEVSQGFWLIGFKRDKFLIRQIEHNEKFADDIIDTQKTHGSILGDIRDILKQQ